ncbi:hypothetical protein GO755_38670 [Spirosoma sp. HMF4905]|uniref:Uncharacterized protein n=1 Tax=Spirosoma arboris TaxID=2682092 RepID=A0A7K1SQC6_9BACT|nr:hypothetical protein [Spirosoma arboris]MVM36002.1 hypothetical protein [Spirosoma arboris]
MEPKKLTMRDLQKMEKGEMPMTEEGQRRLAEMKEMADKIKASIAASQSAINPVIVALTAATRTTESAIAQFHTGQAAAKLAVGSLAANIKGFQESMRPFIEQMAEALRVTRLIKGTAEEVYEKEKGFYEKKYGLTIRDYDTFWYWLCEEFDNHLSQNDEAKIQVDYEAIVNYYGRFYKGQMERRVLLVESEPVVGKSTSGVKNRKTQSDIESCYSFIEAFIDEENASEIIEKLKNLYKGVDPGQYAYMLYALYDLGLISDPATANKTKLHQRLNATFTNVGSRQNLNDHINRLNAPSQHENIEIQNHKRKIQNFK